MSNHLTVTCGAPGTDFPGYSNRSIQSAINYVASLGGGEVVLSKGTFNLADSVHMKSYVSLSGQGSETILLKDAMIEDDVFHVAGYGHCEVMATHPEKFQIGMGVYLTEDHANGGFYATQSTIISISDHLLGLADPLNGDISCQRHGRIRTLFPLIKGAFEKHISVRDLVLDGFIEKNECIDGCRGGCVFFLGCSYVKMSGLECRNYNRDGISYQQCYDVLTENCYVHDLAGYGMHPGSGTILSTIRNCHVERCGEDGVYYCLRTQFLRLENCVIESNRRFGITVGHHDNYTDIIGNTIRNNGWEGIFFRTDNIPYGSGDFSVIANNVLEGNGFTTDEDRTCEIHIMDSVEGLRIYNNTVNNDKKIPLKIEKPLLDSYVYGNNFKATLGPNVPADAKGFSEEAPEKERFLTDFPITEDTLAHLRHICR